jgi:drug/metabolite transporter (DMT)-like permease
MSPLALARPVFFACRQFIQQTPAALAGRINRWRLGWQVGLAVACLGAFVALTWVRAESLATMMPDSLNLGLGVLTGLLGNSLGYWVGALGVAPVRACIVSQSLKLGQIVGVPAGYLLLGGHMLLMPVLGAVLALAALVWAHRRGLSCSAR